MPPYTTTCNNVHSSIFQGDVDRATLTPTAVPGQTKFQKLPPTPPPQKNCFLNTTVLLVAAGTGVERILQEVAAAFSDSEAV